MVFLSFEEKFVDKPFQSCSRYDDCYSRSSLHIAMCGSH